MGEGNVGASDSGFLALGITRIIRSSWYESRGSTVKIAFLTAGVQPLGTSAGSVVGRTNPRYCQRFQTQGRFSPMKKTSLPGVYPLPEKTCSLRTAD